MGSRAFLNLFKFVINLSFFTLLEVQPDAGLPSSTNHGQMHSSIRLWLAQTGKHVPCLPCIFTSVVQTIRYRTKG
jgi:hypothetical protein